MYHGAPLPRWAFWFHGPHHVGTANVFFFGHHCAEPTSRVFLLATPSTGSHSRPVGQWSSRQPFVNSWSCTLKSTALHGRALASILASLYCLRPSYTTTRKQAGVSIKNRRGFLTKTRNILWLSVLINSAQLGVTEELFRRLASRVVFWARKRSYSECSNRFKH